ncbi:gamma-glutamylcyclotransferase family protein [Methylomonas montana]|uniref:gamma-glutamylcyclotransferase family protein n=1 Tax=Methylomonas montana TaxID=3058963 RepID=UPI002659C23C|nr:gamma-glutamylcyclotransferase family protein [Methylomonas montana]WKJ88970.1 gamma-glutamylcyclotransferase family protein [Methylomonas montana]
MTQVLQYLFVYGTLRRDQTSLINHPLLADCIYIGEARIGAELYEVDRYPAAIAAESGFVTGELYRLPNPEQTLAMLDIYEECAAQFQAPHEYARSQHPVILPGQQPLSAWTYLYNRPIDGLSRIRSGDYCHNPLENS